MGVALGCRPTSEGFTTGNVFVRTSGGEFLNSDGANRRGSEENWERNDVRIVELCSAINDPKEPWSPLVKLHNLARNWNRPADDDRIQNAEYERSGGSGLEIESGQTKWRFL